MHSALISLIFEAINTIKSVDVDNNLQSNFSHLYANGITILSPSSMKKIIYGWGGGSPKALDKTWNLHLILTNWLSSNLLRSGLNQLRWS